MKYSSTSGRHRKIQSSGIGVQRIIALRVRLLIYIRFFLVILLLSAQVFLCQIAAAGMAL